MTTVLEHSFKYNNLNFHTAAYNKEVSSRNTWDQDECFSTSLYNTRSDLHL